MRITGFIVGSLIIHSSQTTLDFWQIVFPNQLNGFLTIGYRLSDSISAVPLLRLVLERRAGSQSCQADHKTVAAAA